MEATLYFLKKKKKKKKTHSPQNVNSAVQKSNKKYLVSVYHKTHAVLVSKDKQPAGDENRANVRQGLNGQKRLSYPTLSDPMD